MTDRVSPSLTDEGSAEARRMAVTPELSQLSLTLQSEPIWGTGGGLPVESVAQAREDDAVTTSIAEIEQPEAPASVAPATQVRQGDVFLVPVSAIPDDSRPVKRDAGRVVLAYGEATGHAHAIRSPKATLLRLGDERYLRVAAPVTLGHEEHAPIELPTGNYRVVIQREYVPSDISADTFRAVRD